MCNRWPPLILIIIYSFWKEFYMDDCNTITSYYTISHATVGLHILQSSTVWYSFAVCTYKNKWHLIIITWGAPVRKWVFLLPVQWANFRLILVKEQECKLSICLTTFFFFCLSPVWEMITAFSGQACLLGIYNGIREASCQTRIAPCYLFTLHATSLLYLVVVHK